MIKVDETDPVGDVEPKFPFREVTIKRGVNVNEYYDLLGEIGRGKFGTVYKCKEKSTGLELAAKIISIPNRKERRNVESEIDMMNALKHPKIIQLYDAYEYDKMVCVVLELIEGGELFDRVLDDKFILTEKACSIFVRQICEALDYMHEHNIIHLDLKPENILCLTESGNRIKLIDFGLAREYDPDKKLQVLFGTPEFVAPEVVNFDRITFATDMWSVGVIAYVLVSGLSPFAGDTDIDTMANVTIGKYDFLDEAFDTVSPECIEFITKLLVKEHGDRLTAKEALRHKWVKKRPRYHPLNKEPSTPLAFKNYMNDKNNELSTAKDNLKDFVNRWNDSQAYVFDKDSNIISPVQSTLSSSIGSHSSSQSGSLSSSSEILNKNCIDEDFANEPVQSSLPSTLVLDIESSNQETSSISLPTTTTNPDPMPQNNNINNNPASVVIKNMSLKEFLQNFDRRNSDSSLVVNKSTSTANRVSLFDEIKKITDYLFKMKSQQCKEIPQQVEEQQLLEPSPENDEKKMKEEKQQEDAANVEKKCEQEQKDKEHEKNIINSEEHSSKKSNDSVDVNNNRLVQMSGKSDDGVAKSKGTKIQIPSRADENISALLKKFSSVAEEKDGAKMTVPWSISSKRTKFRINQMSSRDVPIMKISQQTQSKLQKQNAIVTSETLFQETVIKPQSSIEITEKSNNQIFGTDLLKKFQQETAKKLNCHSLFQQHHMELKKSEHVLNGQLQQQQQQQSISFDFGGLNMDRSFEQRTINSIQTFFHLHAKSGTTVQQIKKEIEAKHK